MRNDEINQVPVSEDVDKFLQTVKLPVRPTKVKWQVTALGIPSSVPGPTDYVFFGLIELNEKDEKQLLSELGSGETETWENNSVKKNLVKDWFSDDEKSQINDALAQKETIEILKFDIRKYSYGYNSGGMKKILNTKFYLITLSTS